MVMEVPNMILITLLSACIWNSQQLVLQHALVDHEEGAVNVDTDHQDLLYLDITMIVELPSFTPFTSCPVESYPVPVGSAVTAVLNNKILVCGGSDGENWADAVYYSACYSLTGSNWTEEADMVERREGAASSIWPGHGLLVTGGINGIALLSSSEYLSASGQWTPGPVLPVGMYNHCQVTAGSDVIITGGTDGSYSWLASAYKISTDGSSWIPLPSMASGRSSHACVVHQDYLYVFGGDGAAKSVEKMNLTSNTWETGPELDTDFWVGKAIVYQDTIFLVYRRGKVVKLNTEDKWEEVADLGRTIGWRAVNPAPVVTPGVIGC